MSTPSARFFFEVGTSVISNNNNRGILFQSFNQTRRKKFVKKDPVFKKKSFVRIMHPTQKCFGNGKIKGSALWIVGTSTIFPRFGSL
jgi:hypothetical protein